ncbi:acyl-CoA thioesterase II [Actinomadura craniellae]|uniref:Acyl-CoA thioesterase II n=1 Tax=Actinomadura craniellae TaxID=2231787 RepID=A0A365HBG1_9ACTN|nr:acyl-CoA thioesterase domain-containing protein [Actinomadura craniellae]RAY16421.1 acyl-CoA thioesterase II [Actinomadura craniellae]
MNDSAVERLLALLDLDPVGDDTFAGSPGSNQPGDRLFGGQVAAQSLRAACLTVAPDRRPHSLHAYFIRPGLPDEPLRFEVRRTRDGRSFSTRHVTAAQGGKPIFELIASFQVTEPGEEWQPPAPAGLPGPEDIGPIELPDWVSALAVFDIRPVRGPAADGFVLTHPFWIRVPAPVGDDPAVHACLLTFLSDIGVVHSAMAPGWDTPISHAASLDHALWFHHQPRVDEWLLYSVTPTGGAGARGLAHGTLHTEAGLLVASVTQEALLRPA